MKKIVAVIFVFIGIVFIVGCAGQVELESVGEPTTTRTLTPIPSKTATAEPTATFTPVPTKSEAEKEAFIREMYETNGGCDLPCFWGIEPGQELDDVVNKFAPYSTIFKKDRDGTNFSTRIRITPIDEINLYHRDEWEIEVGYEDNSVKSIAAYADYLSLFKDQDMSVLLESLGLPSEVWIWVIPESPSGPFYRISYFCPDKGAIVIWEGELDSVEFTETGYSTTICPIDFVNNLDMELFVPPYFFFWNPEEELSFQALNDKYILGQTNLLLLSSNNSDAKLDEFYELYIQEGKCFTYFEE